jgi:hypothetical protein
MGKDLNVRLEGVGLLLCQLMNSHNGHSSDTVFYSILKSERRTTKKQYFTNFKAIL